MFLADLSDPRTGDILLPEDTEEAIAKEDELYLNKHCINAQEDTQKIEEDDEERYVQKSTIGDPIVSSSEEARVETKPDMVEKMEGIEFVTEVVAIEDVKESETFIAQIIESIIAEVIKDLDQVKEIVSNVGAESENAKNSDLSGSVEAEEEKYIEVIQKIDVDPEVLPEKAEEEKDKLEVNPESNQDVEVSLHHIKENSDHQIVEPVKILKAEEKSVELVLADNENNNGEVSDSKEIQKVDSVMENEVSQPGNVEEIKENTEAEMMVDNTHATQNIDPEVEEEVVPVPCREETDVPRILDVETENCSGSEDVNGNVSNKRSDQVHQVQETDDVVPEEFQVEFMKFPESKPDVAEESLPHTYDVAEECADIPTDSSHNDLPISDPVETNFGPGEKEGEMLLVLTAEQEDNANKDSKEAASKVEDEEDIVEVLEPSKIDDVLETNVENKTGQTEGGSQNIARIEDDEASGDAESDGEEEEEEMTEPGGRSFMSLVEDRENQAKTLKKMAEFKVRHPVGVCLLADGSIAVACRNQNVVMRFSKTGNELISLESSRGFDRPTDILQLRSGEVVVRDHNGLQLFGEDHRFQTTIGEEDCNRYYGLAEDNQGRIVTININASLKDPGKGTKTKKSHTDIFYFTKAGDHVKTVELAEIVSEEMRPRSMCLYLGYSNNKLFIVDNGLEAIYCVLGQDGQEAVVVFGNSGTQLGQFRSPAGIVVDDFGNSIVVDSGNNRLQLFDSEYNNVGPIQVKVNTNLCYVDVHQYLFAGWPAPPQETLWNLFRQR